MFCIYVFYCSKNKRKYNRFVIHFYFKMSSKLLKKQLQQLQNISNKDETQNNSDKSIEY